MWFRPTFFRYLISMTLATFSSSQLHDLIRTLQSPPTFDGFVTYQAILCSTVYHCFINSTVLMQVWSINATHTPSRREGKNFLQWILNQWMQKLLSMRSLLSFSPQLLSFPPAKLLSFPPQLLSFPPPVTIIPTAVTIVSTTSYYHFHHQLLSIPLPVTIYPTASYHPSHRQLLSFPPQLPSFPPLLLSFPSQNHIA